MTISAVCDPEIEEPPYLDEAEVAIEAEEATERSVAEMAVPPGCSSIFDALLYLSRTNDYDHQLAFFLLHQVFVCLSRHDRMEDWPPLTEMWKYAEHKAHEALEN